MDKNFLFVAACAASLCLGAETVRMPLEWNPTYDTSVPYEVEISPAKLQKLALADPSAGFAVTAQTAAGAKRLRKVAVADFQGAWLLPGLSAPRAPSSHPRLGRDGGRPVKGEGNFETAGDTAAYRY